MSAELISSASSYPDRTSLLAERETRMKRLVRQDISLLRALAFAACIALICTSVYSAPKYIVSGKALYVISAVVLLIAVCGGCGAILNRMRVENQRRWEAIQSWVALAHTDEGRALPKGNMTPELALSYDRAVGNVVIQPGVSGSTEAPMQYGWGNSPKARTIFSAVLFLLGSIAFIFAVLGSIGGISPQSVGLAGSSLIFTLAMRAVFRRVPNHAKWCFDQHQEAIAVADRERERRVSEGGAS
ncbi:hypothetical protein [Streptomyces sp. NPDC053542]|uniref:hypothetical protein n=1 Tax=Streptomyces sp. NPDC053542 TaxID=3365710 RepID=UPI0037CE2F59